MSPSSPNPLWWIGTESNKVCNYCCTLQESHPSDCQQDWSLLSIRNQRGFISLSVWSTGKRQALDQCSPGCHKSALHINRASKPYQTGRSWVLLQGWKIPSAPWGRYRQGGNMHCHIWVTELSAPPSQALTLWRRAALGTPWAANPPDDSSFQGQQTPGAAVSSAAGCRGLTCKLPKKTGCYSLRYVPWEMQLLFVLGNGLL